MLERILFLCFAVAVVSTYEHADLTGAKVYTVYPKTHNQLGFLMNLEIKCRGVDILHHARYEGMEARILVSKKSQTLFESQLKLAGISFKIYIEDALGVAEDEIRMNDIARKLSNQNSKISFTAYHTHAEINRYLDDLAKRFPTRVTVRSVAKTIEGRDLKVIIISTNGGNDTSKPMFIADAGIHAREWISPPVALYMITKLVEDVTESDVVENMDWVIFPVLNPDGYDYTFKSNQTRFWRKNRSLETSIDCPGVDGNRNFDDDWNSEGISDPCSEVFPGPRAFSEPETSGFRDVVLEFKERHRVHLAIHSYGSVILHSYHKDMPISDDEERYAVGLKVVEAINKFSTPESKQYTVVNGSVVGASDDWTYTYGKIKLTYTLELPSGGSGGFDMPPSGIRQVVKETWEGILALARYVIDQSMSRK